MTSKTISLTGTEIRADYSGGTNVWLRNDGTDVIYASTTPGITAGADGVISIPAGQAAAVYGAAGTVFLLGTGSVQLVGSDYTACPFKTSAQAGGSGADEVARAAISAHAGNADIHISTAEKAAWNGKAELSDIPDKLPADGGNADTLDGLHASEFVQNMLNQNYHFSMVFGDHAYITTEMDSNVPNLPAVSNYTHIVSRRDSGEVETVLSIGTDYTKNVYVYRKNDGIWKNLSDGGNATTAITLSDWSGSVIENADDAPLGLSKIDANSANNPFKFWAEILTLGEASNQSYRQQWAFPWSKNEAPLKPKYRVKDSGEWGPWQKLNDGGNAASVGAYTEAKIAALEARIAALEGGNV